MKYILTTFAFITALLCLTPWVQAVEVGDIFYHDGSFDKPLKMIRYRSAWFIGFQNAVTMVIS